MPMPNMRPRAKIFPASWVTAILFVAGLAQAQPDESEGTWSRPDLVELVKIDSTIKLDIRYATSNNFIKRRMYTHARAFLQQPAAEALLRAQSKLRERGYVILVFDGYRPWSVTKMFRDEKPQSHGSMLPTPRRAQSITVEARWTVHCMI